jgi:hypothetical protein
VRAKARVIVDQKAPAVTREERDKRETGDVTKDEDKDKDEDEDEARKEPRTRNSVST